MSATRHTWGSVPFRLVVVTTSLGGLAALAEVLAGLPEQFDVPVAVVHHRSAAADDERQARLLQDHTALPVRVGEHLQPALVPGVALIPAGQKATLSTGLRYHLAPATTATQRRTCGDSLLLSAAERLGPTVIAVVLTGGLDDGTLGVRAVKCRRGRVLIQEPNTARAPAMPVNAIATGCVDFVLPLNRISTALISLALAPGGADLLAVATPPWARLHN